LQAYIKAAMPYWKPGSLTEEESWLVTAFLLRENGIQWNEKLDASNADQILLSPGGSPLTPTPELVAETRVLQTRPILSGWILALAAVVIIFVVAVALRRRSTD
jgi:hypothetical protein